MGALLERPRARLAGFGPRDEGPGRTAGHGFPGPTVGPVAKPVDLIPALGKEPKVLLVSRDYPAVYDHAADVATLDADLAAVAKLGRWGMIVTAPGKGGVDFVSRFFVPAKGASAS